MFLKLTKGFDNARIKIFGYKADDGTLGLSNDNLVDIN